jgi:peroxiredoxin Q/BCP
MSALRPRDPAPLFQTRTADGDVWSLADHLGKPVVLYFYPKDETPGCTAQACDVRDNWSAFAALGVEVVGISPDDEVSHQSFRANHDLPQTLLVDPDHAVLRSYGAWGLKERNGKQVEGVIRSSVVIGRDGTVIAVFSPIDPADQSRLALDALRNAEQA